MADEEQKTILERFGCLHNVTDAAPMRVIRGLVANSRRMLQERGFTDIQEVCDDDVLATIASGVEPILRSRTTAGGSIAVFIHGEERVGVKFARHVHDLGFSRNVIISIEGPTSFTRRECEQRPIQFISAQDMSVTIIDHVLVPVHTPVSADECPVAAANLPRILETDKVVQYYDWPIGTIVKIVRAWGGHEPITYYRVVVRDPR